MSSACITPNTVAAGGHKSIGGTKWGTQWRAFTLAANDTSITPDAGQATGARDTWRLAPILLQRLRVRAQSLVFINTHLVGNIEVCTVVSRCLVIQHALHERATVLWNDSHVITIFLQILCILLQ